VLIVRSGTAPAGPELGSAVLALLHGVPGVRVVVEVALLRRLHELAVLVEVDDERRRCRLRLASRVPPRCGAGSLSTFCTAFSFSDLVPFVSTSRGAASTSSWRVGSLTATPACATAGRSAAEKPSAGSPSRGRTARLARLVVIHLPPSPARTRRGGAAPGASPAAWGSASTGSGRHPDVSPSLMDHHGGPRVTGELGAVPGETLLPALRAPGGFQSPPQEYTFEAVKAEGLAAITTE
jgi:hypothetical protein